MEYQKQMSARKSIAFDPSIRKMAPSQSPCGPAIVPDLANDFDNPRGLGVDAARA
jgi:hypothetical protein